MILKVIIWPLFSTLIRLPPYLYHLKKLGYRHRTNTWLFTSKFDVWGMIQPKRTPHHTMLGCSISKARTFRSDGRTSLTPCALSWDIIARAAHSAASRTATTWSEKETKSNGSIWITYLPLKREALCVYWSYMDIKKNLYQ